MGKRGGGRGRGGRGGGQRHDIRGRGGRFPSGVARGGDRRDDRDNPDARNGWGTANVEDLQHNDVFEAYYLDQGILTFDEWQAFLEHMRAPLPTSFRITSGKAVTTVLLEQMRDFYLPYLSNVEFEGQPVPPPKPLPWYPEGMAWQIDVKKNALRKTEQFKKFQHFLVHETEVGNISRQETVSMIPPLFLGVEPHHIVLDMCAAPGSKTAQLIEALHSPLTTASESYDPCPPGFVVANDSDAKRAHMLVHQSSRLPSPNIVVANCDAARWPSVRVPWLPEGSNSVVDKTLKYDRILADVPCSGDGTIRKNLMIWQDWHPHNGAALHPLQLRILMRGVSSLRNGGRIVYSTCSLNPLENEAVVAAALRECHGTLRLVDQSSAFPELKRRKGLISWKVLPSRGGKQKYSKKTADPSADGAEHGEGDAADGAGTGATSSEAADTLAQYRAKLPDLPWTNSWDDVEDEFKERVPKTLWPQGDEAELGLERCMRVVPHDQNTGGFFVAVLEKDDPKEERLDEGMAVGMVRAMQQRQKADDGSNAGVDSTIASTSNGVETSDFPAAANGKKREHSPEAAAELAEARAKRPREAETKQQSDDIGLPGGTPFREDPMVYVDTRNEQSERIVSFFGLTGAFDPHNLLVRNREGNPLRSLYMTSTSARALISGGGPGKGEHPYGNPLRMRLINCGVRAFARQDSGKDAALKCKWRVTADAVPALRPLVDTPKVLQGTLEDFAFLTGNHYPKFGDLPPNPLRDAIEMADMGSHLLDVAPGTWEGHTLLRPMCVPLWRAAASVNLMLDRQEKSALSYRIFGRDLSNPSGDRQFSQSRAQVQAQQAAAQKKRDRHGGPVSAGPSAPVGLSMDEDELEALENSGQSMAAATAVAAQHVSTNADAGAAAVQAAEEEGPETKAQVAEEGQELPAEEAATAVVDGSLDATLADGAVSAPGV